MVDARSALYGRYGKARWILVVIVAGYRFSCGIQEVVDSIPFSSTNDIKSLTVVSVKPFCVVERQ